MSKWKCTQCDGENSPCICEMADYDLPPTHCMIDGTDDAVWEIVKDETLPKLPDWCKVGEWVYHHSKYGKITNIDTLNKEISVSKDQNDNAYTYSFAAALESFRCARLRPYTPEEMKALVGKVIKSIFGYFLCTAFRTQQQTIEFGPYAQTADSLLIRDFSIDGKPCGVLEHLDNGVWEK